MLIPYPRIWGIRNLLYIPATLYRILVRFVKNGRAIGIAFHVASNFATAFLQLPVEGASYSLASSPAKFSQRKNATERNGENWAWYTLQG